jgi:hypothetical protein
MSISHTIYPGTDLKDLKNHGQLIKELSDEILRVLETDQAVKDMIKSKTAAKFQELKDRVK